MPELQTILPYRVWRADDGEGNPLACACGMRGPSPYDEGGLSAIAAPGGSPPYCIESGRARLQGYRTTDMNFYHKGGELMPRSKSGQVRRRTQIRQRQQRRLKKKKAALKELLANR